MHFGCLQIDQKTNEIFLRIFALASNKRSNQKSCVRESKQNPPISGIRLGISALIFYLTSWLGQKYLQFLLVFWSI